MNCILILLPTQQYRIPWIKKIIKELNIDNIWLYKHKKYISGVCMSKYVFLNASFDEYYNELKNKIDIDVGWSVSKNHVTYYINPYDKEIIREFNNLGYQMIKNSEFFLLNEDESTNYLNNKKGKKVLFTNIYKYFRSKNNILMHGDKPIGGIWSFDKDNQGVPEDKKSPIEEVALGDNKIWEKWKMLAKKNIADIIPNTDCQIRYAINRHEVNKLADKFIKQRLNHFGDYQDFYDRYNYQVNHSMMSVYLNVGLITPKELLNKALKYSKKVRINNLEGFIRQLFWREYMYIIYKSGIKGNYFKNYNKIDKLFWYGKTNIEPLDHAIHLVQNTGYAHHIIRLMILGSYLLMKQTNPGEVFQWFNSMFVDAYDWVMWGNVYCMSQYANQQFTTRPYFSSSAYILRMSNFEKGDWVNKWDAIFHSFLQSKKILLKKIYLVSRWV